MSTSTAFDRKSVKHALVYADHVAATPAPCRYGHIDCAAWEGGPCVDEMFTLLGIDEDGNPVHQE